MKKSLKKTELVAHIQNTIGLCLGNAPGLLHGIQVVNFFSYQCCSSPEVFAKAIAAEIDTFLKSFQATTKAGNKALLGVMSMALPRVFFLERGESVSVSVRPSTPPLCQVVVQILTYPGHSNGVGPFLAAMHPFLPADPNYRDFVSSYLLQVELEIPVEHPLLLLRELNAAALLARYPDAKEMLTKTTLSSERVYGARVPAGLDLTQFATLRDLSHAEGFEWLPAPRPSAASPS